MRSRFIKYFVFIIFTLFVPITQVGANAPDFYGDISTATGAPIPQGVVFINSTDGRGVYGGGTITTNGYAGSGGRAGSGFYFCSCQGSQIYGNHCNACSNTSAGSDTGWCSEGSGPGGVWGCSGHGCKENAISFSCSTTSGSCSGGFSTNISNSGTQTHVGDFTYYPPEVCDSSIAGNYCQGTTYPDNYGSYTCSGTKQPACVNGISVCGGTCDSTPPQVSITNPPADTCYKGPTGSNGTPFSNTQPILVRVDDTHNSQGTSVPTSGISSVSIRVISLANNSVTRTVTGSLSSGSATNGTYSITIPQDSTTFPTNGGRYSITAFASDNANHTSNTASSSFSYDATGNSCQAPHIQTQNGDVHSQTNVGQ